MPSFRYRALTQSGELVSGSITAPTASEVANRIEYLGLVPIETITEARDTYEGRLSFSLFSRPRAEDVTVFTRDLALLLKAGARIDDALDLLAVDIDIGRLRPMVAQIRGRVLAGESLSEALAASSDACFRRCMSRWFASARRPARSTMFSTCSAANAAAARPCAARWWMPCAIRPSCCSPPARVLSFFLLFVLPQFAAVLQDFNAKLDPIVAALFGLSKFVRAHLDVIEVDDRRFDRLRLAGVSPRRGARKDRRPC